MSAFELEKARIKARAAQANAIEQLARYSACDVADALLKLEKSKGSVPRAGFLADIGLRTPASRVPRVRKAIGPAFTVLFHSKEHPELNSDVEPNLSPGEQWSDIVPNQSVVVVKQPEGQKCAAVGGHHASRLSWLGTQALVVSGRVRDISDMAELGMPVWSRGTSIVGAGAESKPHAVQVPLNVDGVTVSPGDLIFCDQEEGGIVRIPADLVDQVLEFLPKHAAAEQAIKEDVSGGSTIERAFATHR